MNPRTADPTMAQPLPASTEAFPRARKRGDFIGVDEASFPRDFAVFVRYHVDFLRKTPARHPSPPVLTLKELDEFVSHTGERYRGAWLKRQNPHGQPLGIYWALVNQPRVNSTG
jgi:hypothetical protein